MYKSQPCLPIQVSTVNIPAEIWLNVFKFAPKPALLKIRIVNRKLSKLANIELLERSQAKFYLDCVYTREKQLEHKQMQIVKRPLLVHFREFLTAPSTAENLTEVTWFANAPPEVQVVCECLCRLKGGIDLPDDVRMSWSDIRRIMKKQDFKMWLMCLATNVDFISIIDIKKVEQIIRMDPLITYERLREVSMSGYRLLILIAASLQYATNADELSRKRIECEIAESKLDTFSRFMDAITLHLC
ncbi:hypothetical protein HDV06_004207 [Boothiomyces sp. JEL0866]|nr:hypothetical protein HDV06_004207 [Boothiomyces sp. JEL0866]